jgi:hypothetical protein
VDIAALNDPTTSQRYLIGGTTPDDGDTCPTLVAEATARLGFLQSTV